MRRAIQFLLAGAVVAAACGGVRAETPENFLRRFLADPGIVFDGNVKPIKKPAAKTALVPIANVPLPHLRPVTAAAVPLLGYQGPDAAAEAIVAAPTEDMPLPHLRPADILPAITAPPAFHPTIQPQLAALPKTPPPEPLPKLIRPPPAATSTCGMAIARLGVIATPLSPIEEGDCGIDAPVAVSALDGGAIDLSTKAIIECDTAERLANWIKDTVAPKAEKAFGGKLTGLRIADSYSCRTRNHIPDAKLSEHAHGDAVDISAFRIGKRWIEVGPGWTGGGDDTSFLTDVRQSACGPFTTVLGPGSDSFHTDHFHLDIIKRRTAGRSKGLYCK